MRGKTSLGVSLIVIACLGAAGVVAAPYLAPHLASHLVPGSLVPAPAASATTPQDAAPTPAPSRPRSTTQAGPRPAEGAAVPDFTGAPASDAVREVARWAFASGDATGRHVVIVDKRLARAFVLDPGGRLLGHSPVLLGLARGDHTVPGIGDRPLSQVQPDERTTPAGRFVPEPGTNMQGEDIVWIDYDAAVSMHRVRAQVKAERRLERLASATPADNRISYGCINLPPVFYERVLLPAVKASAVVYVLPEVRPLAEVFGPGLRATRPHVAGRAPVGQADGV